MQWSRYPDETGLVVMQRSALRIDDVDQLRLSPTERISVVWVDISERPDLAALAARNVPEPSEVECSWFSGNVGTRKMLVGLRIAMIEPATAVFTLVFPLERFAGHLLTIAKFGRLWIVPGPPLPHPVGTQAGDAQTFIAHVSRYTGQGVLVELDPQLCDKMRVQSHCLTRNLTLHSSTNTASGNIVTFSILSPLHPFPFAQKTGSPL